MPLPSPVSENVRTCNPDSCRAGCALEVIDGLLRANGSVCGEEVDALLDLRWLLRQRQDAEASLGLFCQLRRKMEERHYLAFYRMRRWLENHVLASARFEGDEQERAVAICTQWYCIEAIRHQSLKSALAFQESAKARVRFVFRAVSSHAEVPECLAKLSEL